MLLSSSGSYCWLLLLANSSGGYCWVLGHIKMLGR